MTNQNINPKFNLIDDEDDGNYEAVRDQRAAEKIDRLTATAQTIATDTPTAAAITAAMHRLAFEMVSVVYDLRDTIKLLAFEETSDNVFTLSLDPDADFYPISEEDSVYFEIEYTDDGCWNVSEAISDDGFGHDSVGAAIFDATNRVVDYLRDEIQASRYYFSDTAHADHPFLTAERVTNDDEAAALLCNFYDADVAAYLIRAHRARYGWAQWQHDLEWIIVEQTRETGNCRGCGNVIARADRREDLPELDKHVLAENSEGGMDIIATRTIRQVPRDTMGEW